MITNTYIQTGLLYGKCYVISTYYSVSWYVFLGLFLSKYGSSDSEETGYSLFTDSFFSSPKINKSTYNYVFVCTNIQNTPTKLKNRQTHFSLYSTHNANFEGGGFSDAMMVQQYKQNCVKNVQVKSWQCNICNKIVNTRKSILWIYFYTHHRITQTYRVLNLYSLCVCVMYIQSNLCDHCWQLVNLNIRYDRNICTAISSAILQALRLGFFGKIPHLCRPSEHLDLDLRVFLPFFSALASSLCSTLFPFFPFTRLLFS